MKRLRRLRTMINKHEECEKNLSSATCRQRVAATSPGTFNFDYIQMKWNEIPRISDHNENSSRPHARWNKNMQMRFADDIRLTSARGKFPFAWEPPNGGEISTLILPKNICAFNGIRSLLSFWQSAETGDEITKQKTCCENEKFLIFANVFKHLLNCGRGQMFLVCCYRQPSNLIIFFILTRHI